MGGLSPLKVEAVQSREAWFLGGEPDHISSGALVKLGMRMSSCFQWLIRCSLYEKKGERMKHKRVA